MVGVESAQPMGTLDGVFNSRPFALLRGWRSRVDEVFIATKSSGTKGTLLQGQMSRGRADCRNEETEEKEWMWALRTLWLTFGGRDIRETLLQTLEARAEWIFALIFSLWKLSHLADLEKSFGSTWRTLLAARPKQLWCAADFGPLFYSPAFNSASAGIINNPMLTGFVKKF